MSTRSRRGRGSTVRKQRLDSTSSTGSSDSPEKPNPLTMCRVCMKSKPDSLLVHLFDKTVLGECLAAVLSKVGAVDVQEQDRIPKLCCTRCLQNVEAAFKLRKLCQESDRKLRELFSDGREEEMMVIKTEQELAVDVEYVPLPVDVLIPDMDEKTSQSSSLNPVPTKIVQGDMDTSSVKDELVSGDENEHSDNSDDENSQDEEDSKEYKPSKRGRKASTAISKKQTKPEFPDVFVEVPAVSFICCGCRNRFASEEELQAHSQAVHAVNKIPASQLKGRKQCEICYKKLRDSYAYEIHKQIGRLNYRCKTCGDVFPSRKRVCTHYERIHGPHPVVTGAVRICCGCAQKFDTLEALKEHSEAVHSPKKLPPDEKRPFICEICYHNFPTELRLYAHQIRLIKGRHEKKHQCVHCGKTFISAGVLRDHEISHTGEKVFQCTDCPKTYTNKDAYRKHIYRHAQPKDRYKCTVCERTFKTKQSLYEHGLAHTGERPLECPYCPAKFAREACRISHVRTHTGKKDFPCPQCEKRFPCSSDRNRHLNYFHHKARPFPCFFCPNRYPRKDYRRKHMENAHPAELAANPIPAIELSGGNRWTSTMNAVSAAPVEQQE